jgi:hypothetical protein
MITKTTNPLSASVSDNPLLLDMSSTYKLYFGPYNLGNYNSSSTIPLYMYPYRYDKSNWNNIFRDLYGMGAGTWADAPIRVNMIQGTDYAIEVEQGNIGDTVRVWFYGKGNYKGVDFAWVTLSADVSVPPVVTAVIPNGADAALNGNVVITFNEEMDTNNAAGAVKLNTSVLGAGTWSNSNKTYTAAYSGLAYSSTYVIDINGFKNIAGATMATDNTHSFTTAAKPDAAITISAITGVTVPSAGAVPPATITGTAQFTGTIAWSPSVGGSFNYDTIYTAVITLTANAGYTFNGVSANFFTVFRSTATNSANQGVVTAVFPKTAINQQQQDNADIALAQSIIEGMDFKTAQIECVDEAAAYSKINAILDSPQINGVTKTVNKNSYVMPVAGTKDQPNGTNGSYVFTVELKKGLGTPVVTVQITLDIAATPYAFKTYTVTFDGNGGKFQNGEKSSSKDVTEPAKYVDTLIIPKRDEYKFKEWNTKADGSGKTFTSSSEITGDITVYAQWVTVDNDNNNGASGTFDDWWIIGGIVAGVLFIILLAKAGRRPGQAA